MPLASLESVDALVPAVFEHLEAGADLVSDILGAAGEVQIVTTSRARLHIAGEHCVQIGGMDYPQPATAQARDVVEAGRHSAVKLDAGPAQAIEAGAEACPPTQNLTAEGMD